MPVRGLLVAVVILGILAGGVYWSERNKAARRGQRGERRRHEARHVKERRRSQTGDPASRRLAARD